MYRGAPLTKYAIQHLDLSSRLSRHRHAFWRIGSLPVRLHILRHLQSLHRSQPGGDELDMALGRRAVPLGVCPVRGRVEDIHGVSVLSSGFFSEQADESRVTWLGGSTSPAG